METVPLSYKGHRYPAEVLAHCVRLYFRFPLSFCETTRPDNVKVPFIGLGVDHHSGIAVPPAQGEVVDTDHAGHPPGGQRDA
ncbi:hypothetical protein GCM10010398_64150 [Streptomyces fimbriatus]